MKFSILRTIFLIFSIFLLINIAHASKYPNIYPFIPVASSNIHNDVKAIAEEDDILINFKTIIKNNLSKAKSEKQPWTGSFWPLAKGGIANPFKSSFLPYYLEFARTHFYLWKFTKYKFNKRLRRTLGNINSLSENELAKLAPSEKYDLLMGDESFTLTNNIMKNMYAYGQDNHYFDFQSATVAASDTEELADLYNSWDWKNNKSLEDSLRNDIVLSPRLESQMALELYDSKKVDNLRAALKKVTPLALKEAKNYVLIKERGKNIAAWEGICNGWALASTIVPRPKKAIDFTLENGKKLRFYPSDIKALISLFWVNSKVQKSHSYNQKKDKLYGATLYIGSRCNLRSRRFDEFGRVYDHREDPKSNDFSTPRCSGIHPAKWHLSLINLVGVQKRSFIVDRKVTDPIDNVPLYKYELSYFNPYTGKRRKALDAIQEISKRDQFFKYRNLNTKYIVGVENKTTYIDYAKPNRRETDRASYDHYDTKKMYYDLELDENFNIIGGQYRAVQVGKASRNIPPHRNTNLRKRRLNHNQPDFIWTISKNWKKVGGFNNVEVREAWSNISSAPPKSWHEDYSLNYVNKHVLESTYSSSGKKCSVRHKKTGERREVWCQFNRPTPIPFVNVLNILIERSSGVKIKDY